MGDSPTGGPPHGGVQDPDSAPERASASLPGAGPLPPSLDHGHGPLSDAQRDAVARMVVQGRPLTLISAAVGRSPEALRRMIAGSLRPKIDEVRALVLRETSSHWFEMLAMLPQARANMQSALLSTDESVRVAMSKWLHERIVPAPTQTHEVEHTVNLGEEFSGLLTAMNEKLEAISTLNAGRDPLARVRTGPEALRRPVVVQMSQPAEAGEEPDPAA